LKQYKVIPEPKPGSCGKLSANPRVEHEQNPAQHLATIQPLTARMSEIARDDRQQRLDARPQSVVDLPRLGASLPRPGWLASLRPLSARTDTPSFPAARNPHSGRSPKFIRGEIAAAMREAG
jgi:hypothetical protein